jgi:hypothetical protein
MNQKWIHNWYWTIKQLRNYSLGNSLISQEAFEVLANYTKTNMKPIPYFEQCLGYLEKFFYLFNNRDLKGIIEEYKTLYDNLVRDVYKRQLWTDLMKLYSDIKGGMSLEGYGACHLCPPRTS